MSQYHFVLHKSHMDLLGSNPVLSREKLATDRLSLKSGLYYTSGSSSYGAVNILHHGNTKKSVNLLATDFFSNFSTPCI